MSYKDHKELVAALKQVYTALNAEAAEECLLEFAEKWDGKYPTVSKQWQSKWENITPFFAFPADIRKAIYTTNAIKSMNRSLHKRLKTRGVLPNDDAVFKLIYLSLRHIARRRTMPIRNWKVALNQFAIHFEEIFPF